MITRRTVLILGAGASMPYGFPSGYHLASLVYGHLAEGNNDQLAGRLHGCYGVDFRELHDFVKVWPESGCDSLDEFVEPSGNRRFLPLVKAAIVELLIAREIDHALLAAQTKDWCRYLLSRMRRDATFESFVENRLRVITFNFDRVFERRLFLSLRSAFGVSDGAAASLAKQIDVLHLHGSLGDCLWMVPDSTIGRDFSQAADDDLRRDISQCIKIVHEEVSDLLLEKARGWLREAERIVLLGFGFHPTNSARLALAERYQASVWGTAFGLSGPEVDDAKAKFSSSTTLNLLSMDSYDLLRNYPVLG